MSDLLVERECKGTKKNVYVQTKFIFVAIDYFFLLYIRGNCINKTDAQPFVCDKYMVVSLLLFVD